MRVAVLNQFYAPQRFGGAELSVQMLCEALVARGNEVTVITGSVADTRDRETINGVNVLRIKGGNLYNWNGQKHPVAVRAVWHSIDAWNPMAFRHVRRALCGVRPDLLHTNNLAGFSASAWGAAKSLGVPVAHTLRDYYLLCPSSGMFRGLSNCIRQCAACNLMSIPKRLAARAVRGVIGISEYILRRHQQAGLFAKEQVSGVIPNPVSLPVRPEKQPFNGRGLALGFLGRLEPAKGIEVLLKTLTDHDFCGWSEVIVGGRGSDEYERALRHKYNDSRVKFLGLIDPTAFFNRVDLLVVPSLWNEPFGRVVIEAYAHGVPVVASNRGGLNELVKNGEDGFLFNPDSSDSLRNLLIHLASQVGLMEKLQRGTFSNVSCHSPEAIASAYEGFFARVINKRSFC